MSLFDIVLCVLCGIMYLRRYILWGWPSGRLLGTRPLTQRPVTTLQPTIAAVYPAISVYYRFSRQQPVRHIHPSIIGRPWGAAYYYWLHADTRPNDVLTKSNLSPGTWHRWGLCVRYLGPNYLCRKFLNRDVWHGLHSRAVAQLAYRSSIKSYMPFQLHPVYPMNLSRHRQGG